MLRAGPVGKLVQGGAVRILGRTGALGVFEHAPIGHTDKVGLGSIIGAVHAISDGGAS